MVRHIESNENFHVTLCGIHDLESRHQKVSAWCDYREHWIGVENPNCETCILMNFSNPSATRKSKCGYCVMIEEREMVDYGSSSNR